MSITGLLLCTLVFTIVNDCYCRQADDSIQAVEVESETEPNPPQDQDPDSKPGAPSWSSGSLRDTESV